MRLILVRHGETEENIKKLIQGQLQGILTDNGKKQAGELAERLKHEKIDAIYTSDSARAYDTAKEVHKHHTNIPLLLDKRLRERYWGALEGRHQSEKYKWPEGAETDDDLVERATFLGKFT